MCANSEGSSETAQMRRLAWALDGRLRDKYHNLMSWLICEPLWKKKYFLKQKLYKYHRMQVQIRIFYSSVLCLKAFHVNDFAFWN